MKRAVWLLGCLVVGLCMLAAGWLLPMHLRAVDSGVIQMAGRNSPTLVEEGLTLVSQKKLGAAQMLWQAAQEERVWGQARLGEAINEAAQQDPGLAYWGQSDARLEGLSRTPAPQAAAPQTTGETKTDVPGGVLPWLLTSPAGRAESLTEAMVRQENRDKVVERLQADPAESVQSLLRCRTLTNTLIFSPSQSASGQALDVALGICGLLMEGGHLTAGFSNSMTTMALKANLGESSQPLEQALLDIMSLAQRMNWNQLVTFVGKIEDAETLRRLAGLVRNAGQELPIIFAAIELTDKPAAVADYLMDFSQTGLGDLSQSLRYGAGGVSELLRRNQRFYTSALAQRLGARAPVSGLLEYARNYCLQNPGLGLTIKWVLYLGAGFLLAAGLHFARPPASALEQPLQVRGFHLARESLFALGFLLVVLLVSEPFLAQESQRVELPLRLQLPMAGNAVPAGNAVRSLMNQLSLLTLLLFFVLQALIYIACLVKLAEILRQRVAPRIKLRLLENEEHLFDAGLYLGFVGTIISLILVSLGVIKPSLMAAYSSTSFGIIFVSVFKIFHLRPVRRRLLLEAEAAPAQTGAPLATPTLATTT